MALSLTGAGLAGVHAEAQIQQRSGGDFCTTDSGVTVVVDLTEFGGAIVVRCVDGPLPSGYDGWDALTDAGFNPQSPSRTPGFVCRLSGEPAASRSFDIPENSDYHEQCVNTPPTSAYWGSWYAKNGGSWTYSSTGAASHQVIDGGFEGWAFSLNSGDNPPKPGVAPSHPVSPTTTPSTHTPRPGGGGSPGDGPSGPGGNDDGTTDSPTSSSDDDPASAGGTGPSDGGRGNERQEDGRAGQTVSGPTSSAPTSTSGVLVTGELPSDPSQSDSSGSALPTLLGIGILTALGVGAGVTAWRRRSG
jgi:hypothetical protein